MTSVEEVEQLRAQITRSRYDPSSVGPDAPFFVALEKLCALAIQVCQTPRPNTEESKETK